MSGCLLRRQQAGYAFLFEYVLLWTIVAAAIISMAVYMKRGLAGGFRNVADTFGQGRQFDPVETN